MDQLLSISYQVPNEVVLFDSVSVSLLHAMTTTDVVWYYFRVQIKVAAILNLRYSVSLDLSSERGINSSTAMSIQRNLIHETLNLDVLNHESMSSCWVS